MVIITHPDWRQAMYNEKRTDRGKDTPMRVLIRKFPGTKMSLFLQDDIIDIMNVVKDYYLRI